MEGSAGNPLLAEQLVAAQQRCRRHAPLRPDSTRSSMRGRCASTRSRCASCASLRLRAGRSRPASDRHSRLAMDTCRATPSRSLARQGSQGSSRRPWVSAIELLAEAIEASLLPAERQRYMLALARLLGSDPAEAAWHLAAPDGRQRQAAAHRAAAQMAQRTEPGATALAHLVAALELATVADRATRKSSCWPQRPRPPMRRASSAAPRRSAGRQSRRRGRPSRTVDERPRRSVAA